MLAFFIKRLFFGCQRMRWFCIFEAERKNTTHKMTFVLNHHFKVALKLNWMCFGKTMRSQYYTVTFFPSLWTALYRRIESTKEKKRADRKLLISNEVHKYYFFIVRYCVNECARSTTRSNLIDRICGFGSYGMQLKCFSTFVAMCKKTWRADYFEFETLLK